MFRLARAAAPAILTCALLQTAAAAVPVHIVKTDLKPLIRAAYHSPVQFAVLVPHTASLGTAGKWSVNGDRATWAYAVQIPTAVSMSFHATHVSLPESATLVVRGAKTTTSYRARDVHLGELWSRIHPGEALQLKLMVAAADRNKVAMTIVSLQAGYRSLGVGVQDHPYYRQLKALERPAQVSDNTACVTNYVCQATTANTPAAQATVALVVGGLHQCSGSLINDVPGDNTPYVLTARHCETGQVGGGNPGAAGTVTVYWDAVTNPCGATLLALYYTPQSQIQTGAQTVVEQQDAWLIRLDSSPIVADAQFVGFDASGVSVLGGYTIHHAKGYDKQFAQWYGQAAAVQLSPSQSGVGYTGDFWETVNQLGNIAPGASGGALIDQNNRLVGSLTYGRTTADPSGYGACPVSPPSPPNGVNGVADFTSLSAIWNSTADTTSTTGVTTIKSVLDPTNTGTLVVDSVVAASTTLSASADTPSEGTAIVLTWNAPGATQCTASGGIPGDSWGGTLGPSGTQSLTESVPGPVTYGLDCTFTGNRTVQAAATVYWVGPTPTVQFTPSTYVAWTNSPVVLTWTSNVAPCSLSGGGANQTNLGASGSVTVTQATAGDVSYTLSCGPAGGGASLSQLVQWETPNLMLRANGTDRLLGQSFALGWDTAPNTYCTPSGGAPNDGWTSTAFAPGTIEQFFPQVTTLGTYTYTLQCSAGPVSQQQSVTVTFENNAPYVTASLSTNSITFSDSPADYVTLTYNSNLSVCTLLTSPNLPLTNSGSRNVPPDPQGLVALAPSQSGSYQISMKCDGSPNYDVVSTPMSLTVLPPPPPTETLTFTPGNTVAVQEPFTISWSSTNAQSCDQTGTISGQSMWGGAQGLDQAPSGSTNLYAPTAGQYTLGLTCHSIDANTASTSAATTLNVVNLTANLSASPTSVTVGQSFTLTWSSTGATACNANGGGANGSAWTGTLTTSGSVTQTATTAGSFTYEVDCPLNNLQAMAQAAVTVTTASSGGGAGGGGGGHGGGGGLGVLDLGFLAALLALGRKRGAHAAPEGRCACSARPRQVCRAPESLRSSRTMSSVLAAYCANRVGYSPCKAESTWAAASTTSSAAAPTHCALRHKSITAAAISTTASSTT